MNHRILTLSIASALLATAGAAVAGEATPDHPQPYMSTLTREQVRAELLEARRLGVLAHGEATILISPETAERIRIAGERAVMVRTAASR
jgi:hypothetical protein